MEQMNNLIARHRVNLGKMSPLKWPLSLYVEPSGACNFKCKFCVQSQKQVKSDIMTFKVFQKIIDELEENRVVIPRMSICGIGEPLVNRELPNMLQYLDSHRQENHIVKVAELVTNGSLFNEELAMCIPRYLDRIVISVEGLDGRDYEKFAGINIDFDEFLQHLTLLYNNRGSCKVYIKIHNKAIYGSKERQAQFFELFTPISDGRWIENLSDIFPEFESDLIDTSDGAFRWSVEKEKPSKLIPHMVCPQIFKALLVFANGDCTLCCSDWDRKICIGNINDTSLLEIWHSKRAELIREKHLRFQKDTFSPCRECRSNDYIEIDNIDSAANEILMRMKDKNYAEFT